jgi:plastocyanin
MRAGVAAALGLLISVPALAAEHVVTMAGQQYTPSELTGQPGDTIRFVNDDDTAHDVFVPTVGFGVDLGKQEPRQERALNLARSGKFEVECVFHPDMLLAVTVK